MLKWIRNLIIGTLFATAAAAAQHNVYKFDIPAQTLDSALRAFAKTSRQQILFDGELVHEKRNNALVGDYPVVEGLTILLQGTGLSVSRGEHGAFVIAAAISAKKKVIPATAGAAAGEAPLQHLALADAEGQSQAAASTVETPPVTEADTAGIPEILVQGTRTLNTDIKRTEDAAQPYVVFDRTQIERSMSSNLEDFLKTRLPMNTVEGTNSQSGSSTRGNQSSINLRGLGANQTLILVDGKRMPSVGGAGVFNQPDINGLPLAAIERIEVLPSTASGIYGGGATGGVINIITRQYLGMDLGASYGNAFDSDVAERRLEVSAGFDVEGGRTHVLVSASHTDSNSLLVGDRDFTAQARARQFANNASAFFTAATPPVGYTSNIRSQNGLNLVLDNGTQLNSPHTFVPVGYAGPAADGGSALVANAGRYNLELPRDLLGAEQSLLNNPQVSSASLSLRRAFGERIDAYSDFSWLDNRGRTYFAGGIATSVTLPANAPNNPFDSAINVSFPAPGLSFLRDTGSETLRGTAGLIVRLPRRWSAAADYVWSRSRSSFLSTSPALGDPDGAAGPGIAATAALASGALNVVRDLNAFPLDYTPYLMPSPNFIFGPADTIMQDATLRLSGPVMTLPAGPLTLSAFIERREEEARTMFRDSITATGATFSVLWPGRSQTVQSYYLESQVPLISATQGYRAARTFDLQASIRHDRYLTDSPNPAVAVVPSRAGPYPALTYVDNEVTATKFTLGLRYSPVEDVVLRASFGTGFLPPSINQIVSIPGGISGVQTLIDPKRGGISATVPAFSFVSGGNAGLIAEDSESWSAGAIFTPRLLLGLRVSLDYTRITKTNEIADFVFQALLDLEDSFPGRVTRAAVTAGDAALGYTGGVITEIDISFANIAATRLEAYDMQADYTLPTTRAGDFHFFAIATWQPEFERQAAAGAPFINFADFSGGPLEWRANGGVDWDRGALTVGWSAQYYDSFFSYSGTSAGATQASAVLNQGSATIPAQIYHDMFARYRFDSSPTLLGGIFANSEVTLGIQNLFNEKPPTLATTGTIGGYSNYADPRLRRYTISVRKSFN